MAEIRQLPEQEGRVETGPVQFGDDYPGVFIRGDAAIAFAAALWSMLHGSNHPLFQVKADNLLKLLLECNVNPAFKGFEGLGL
jgi:hypothetical protein